MPHPPPILHNRQIAPPPSRETVRLRSVGSSAKPLAPSLPGQEIATQTGGRTDWSRGSFRNTHSFLVSLVVHCIGLILLALIAPATRSGLGGVALVVNIAGDAEAALVPENLSITLDASQWESSPVVAAVPQPTQVAEAPMIPSPFAAPNSASTASRPTDDTRSVSANSLLVRSSLPTGGGIGGRTQQQRSHLAGVRGATAASENAVELALAWLAAHQRPDGSWSLKLDNAPCQGRCTNSGLLETNTGATALALLPFLGAGYSHQDGPYREVVKNGLYYLTTRMVETANGGDLTENVTMYAQGLSAIALCEGLAMSGDENLRPFAQRAIDFVCYAQHSRGGWRYFPGQPGDITVTGWQVMALKSARLAKLNVSSQSTQLVSDFLNSVQQGDGAFYGYQKPDKQPGPTAVALLLRMYFGWERHDPRLNRGISYLSYLGPSKTDVYFDYYATQVMSHFGGPTWEHWNARMRDHLVASQARGGHERGSWFFPDKHGSMGGRLYTTAMSTMILEVYYRYLPLYGDDAVTDSF